MSFTSRILLNEEKPFHHRYDFIFDRCRCVRQEIVIQNFPYDQTLQLLEPIVMFLSFSLYRLSGSPLAVFDPKICSQHLQECLLKCLMCYDALEIESKDKFQKNRAIIEAIYLMLNIDEPASIRRTLQLNSSLKANFIIRTSLQISISFLQKNYYKVLRDITELPHLISAVASLRIPQLRKEVLRMFSIAYNSRSLSVPIDFLRKLLIYDEMKTLSQDLIDLGIRGDGEEPTKVVFNRMKFDANKSIVSL